MSTYIRLIGYAPHSIAPAPLDALCAELRHKHLGHLSVMQTSRAAAGPPRFSERPVVEPLFLDGYEMEQLFAGIDIADDDDLRDERAPVAIRGLFQVHLLMPVDDSTGLPFAEAEFSAICRLIAARVPQVHLWYGTDDVETGDAGTGDGKADDEEMAYDEMDDDVYGRFDYLSPHALAQLPRLPWKATGPGTPEGDAVLGLSNLVRSAVDRRR